jgi:hypothetical protein
VHNGVKKNTRWGQAAMARWEEVWGLALARFGAEDVQIRIFIGLGAAFIILMIVEGLRASFRPVSARATAHAPAFSPPARKRAAAKSAAQPAFQPFRVRPDAVRAVFKPVKPPVSRHRPERPKIRRVGSSAKARKPSFADEAAPYSPLPPK